jgi:hypothetical protein
VEWFGRVFSQIPEALIVGQGRAEGSKGKSVIIHYALCIMFLGSTQGLKCFLWRNCSESYLANAVVVHVHTLAAL